MAAGDTVTNVYDPLNGKLQYQYIKHSDGSETIWQYDTENKYNWFVAKYEINPTGQTLALTTDMRDGSFIYYTYDLAHGDALQQATQGQQNGTWIQWTYDTTAVQVWSESIGSYTAAGKTISYLTYLRTGAADNKVYDVVNADALQSETYTAPDGSQNLTVYDTTNTNSWYKYVSTVSAAGLQETQTIYDRNGDTEVKTWDTSHGDSLQTDVQQSPSGAHVTVWDTAGTQPWTTYLYDQNAAGQLLDQTFDNRDGTTTLAYFDPAHGDVLSENEVIGSDGEKAIAYYDTARSGTNWSESQIFSSIGRTEITDYLSANGATVVVTQATGWQELQPTEYLNPATGKWGAYVANYENALSVTGDGHGSTERRLYDALGHLTAIYDGYADGSSSVSLIAPDTYRLGVALVTSNFDASGKLIDIVEDTTQGGNGQGSVQNFVTVTAAMLSQSMSQGGTMTFIENGLEVLLKSVAAPSGFAQEQIYWQDLSAGDQARVAGLVGSDGIVHSAGTAVPELSVQGALHYVGAAIGGTVGGLIGGIAGFATGGIVGTALMDVVGVPTAAVVAANIAVNGIEQGVASGWADGGSFGDAAAHIVQEALSTPDYSPGSTPDFNSGGLAPDISYNSIWHIG